MTSPFTPTLAAVVSDEMCVEFVRFDHELLAVYVSLPITDSACVEFHSSGLRIMVLLLRGGKSCTCCTEPARSEKHVRKTSTLRFSKKIRTPEEIGLSYRRHTKSYAKACAQARGSKYDISLSVEKTKRPLLSNR